MLPNNPESTSNVKADILDIFNSVRKGNSSLKNLADFNIKNLDNPLDSVGFLHNKVLIFIMSDDIDASIICNKIPAVNREFNVDILTDCHNLINLCSDGLNRSIDNEDNFKADLLLSLLNENKISEDEYQIVSTTFLISNDLSFNNKINFIKDVERYTITSRDLDNQEKNRILRTFAIYRYSSYYWEIENPQPKRGPVSAYADAMAEHWALNDPESPAQDGKDVYALAGLVSGIVHALTGL